VFATAYYEQNSDLLMLFPHHDEPDRLEPEFLCRPCRQRRVAREGAVVQCKVLLTRNGRYDIIWASSKSQGLCGSMHLPGKFALRDNYFLASLRRSSVHLDKKLKDYTLCKQNYSITLTRVLRINYKEKVKNRCRIIME